MRNSSDTSPKLFSNDQESLLRASVQAYRELLSSDTSAGRAALGHAWADAEIAACDVLLRTQLKDVPSNAPAARPNEVPQITTSVIPQYLDTTVAFLALLNQADSVAVNQQLLQHWETSHVADRGDNEVACFSWESEGVNFCVKLTQESIADGHWCNGYFICKDSEGDTVEILLCKHTAITPPIGDLTSVTTAG